MLEGGDLFPFEVPDSGAGRAGQHGVLKRFSFSVASRAGCIGILVVPRGVGHEVAFRRSHLVDSSSHELPLPHEGVWGKGRVIVIVRGGWASLGQSPRSMFLAWVLGLGRFFTGARGGECSFWEEVGPARPEGSLWGPLAGAGHSKGRKGASVSAVGQNGRDASYPRQDGGGSSDEVVCSPSLDYVPEVVHAPESPGVRGK